MDDGDRAQVASRGLTAVKQVVLVLSVKGGVGKSTVACQVSLAVPAQRPISWPALLRDPRRRQTHSGAGGVGAGVAREACRAPRRGPLW